MFRHRRAKAGGAVAVELALTLPIVLLFVLGLMEFGRLIWIQTTLNYAVQSAARCAAINPSRCGTVAQIQDFAVKAAVGLPVAAGDFAVTKSAACGMGVSASLPFEFAASPLFPYSLTLDASACYPI